jgi:uncharacterized protein
MGRFGVLICWLFWLSIALPGSARAAKVDWLYNVDVAVANQSAQELGVASREALLVVLRRVTGLVDVPLNEAVTSALKSPQRYYVEYRYREETGPLVPGQSAMTKRLLLSVRSLITEAGLPLWSSNRPTTVTWIVVAENAERTLLGSSDPNPLLDAMRGRAQERGLPIVVPLMDLDEQLEVTPAVVWGGMFDVLERASGRYTADDILVGRITHAPTGAWSADWQIGQQDSGRRFTIDSATAEQAGAAIVDRLVDDLVARYAVYGGSAQQLQIRVDGISDVGDYGALLAYLGSLEFIDSVGVQEVNRSGVLVSLATRTPWDRLRDLLALDGRLEPNQSLDTGGPLSMTWRGD